MSEIQIRLSTAAWVFMDLRIYEKIKNQSRPPSDLKTFMINVQNKLNLLTGG